MQGTGCRGGRRKRCWVQGAGGIGCRVQSVCGSRGWVGDWPPTHRDEALEVRVILVAVPLGLHHEDDVLAVQPVEGVVPQVTRHLGGDGGQRQGLVVGWGSEAGLSVCVGGSEAGFSGEGGQRQVLVCVGGGVRGRV